MSYAERFQWIFEARETNPNKLSEDAGLARSYVRGLLKAEAEKRKMRPGASALDALARAANVSSVWLATGKGPREPYESEGELAETRTTPTPAPTSSEAVSESTMNLLIDEVMVKGRHRFSDGVLVCEALAKSPPPAAFIEPRVYVLRLLDTAAWHREQGHKVQAAELPALAVGFLDQELAKRREPSPASEATKKAS